MLNLLLNAVDATAETTKPVIRISTLVVSGQIEIAVNDNGPGIPASVKSQIFEPFFTTKQVGKGTGLGLAVSHTIISGMGGTLEADSVPGNTTFKISIPIQK